MMTMTRSITTTQSPEIPIPELKETGGSKKSFSKDDKKYLEAKLSQESCLLWAYLNQVKTDKGTLIEFQEHRFLKDIFDDWTPEQVVRKAAQVGFSTMNVLKTLWAAKHKNYNIIYTLPTFGDIGQFVPSKVNPLLNYNPILAKWSKDKDTVNQKKVGSGFIYYRGTFSNKADKMDSTAGIMLSADLICYDEADRSDQVIMEQYESRLSNSKYKGKWYFSNPTNPFTLSQKKWEASDQKHWFIKCEHCNEQQYLDFWKNIKDDEFVCSKCFQPLSNEVRQNGQWVRKYNERQVSGYWINHLMCPWITAKQIVEDSKKDPQYFYNFILGLPYVGTGTVIDDIMILKNVTEEANDKQRLVMGIDVGLKKHFIIGNKQGIIKVGTFENWDEARSLFARYDIEACVIDALPDLTEPRKLVKEYPGRIYLSFFKSEIKKTEYIKWDEVTRTVVSDRSKIIGLLVDELDNRKIRFNVRPNELGNLITHFKTIYKEKSEDRMGNLQEQWTTNNSEDHYVFAMCYWRIALEKRMANKVGIFDPLFVPQSELWEAVKKQL